MNVSRHNEQSRVWFRSDRIFMASDNEWFFQTREGIDLGPYETQFEAEIEAGLLKELLEPCVDAEAVRATIREFILDSYEMGRPLAPRFREVPAQRLEGQAVV